MRLNKIRIIFSVLLILGVTLYFLICSQQTPDSNRKSDNPVVNRSSTETPQHFRRQTPVNKPAISSKQLTENAINEAIDSVANRPPERQREILEAGIKFRELRFKALFSSWGLDSQIISKALFILRERDERIDEKKTSMYKQGRTGAKNFPLQQKLEQTIADAKLSLLLGDDRSAQLSEREAEIEIEMKSYVAQFLRTRGM